MIRALTNFYSRGFLNDVVFFRSDVKSSIFAGLFLKLEQIEPFALAAELFAIQTGIKILKAT